MAPPPKARIVVGCNGVEVMSGLWKLGWCFKHWDLGRDRQTHKRHGVLIGLLSFF